MSVPKFGVSNYLFYWREISPIRFESPTAMPNTWFIIQEQFDNRYSIYLDRTHSSQLLKIDIEDLDKAKSECKYIHYKIANSVLVGDPITGIEHIRPRPRFKKDPKYRGYMSIIELNSIVKLELYKTSGSYRFSVLIYDTRFLSHMEITKEDAIKVGWNNWVKFVRPMLHSIRFH